MAGPAAQHVYASWVFTDEERDKIAVLEDKFAEFCEPKKNVTICRYMFNSRSQNSNENFASYLTSLRDLVRQCDYGDLEDDLLRDRIVCGISDSKVREKLLRTGDLTLKVAVDTCTAAEASADQLKTLHPASTSDVHAVSRAGKFHRQSKVPATKLARQPASSGPQNGSRQWDRRHGSQGHGSNAAMSPQIRCVFCTYEHPKGRCPEYGQKCRVCGKMGHFQKSVKCKRRHGQVEAVEMDNRDVDSSDDEENINPEYFSDTVFIDEPNSDENDFFVDVIQMSKSRDWLEHGMVDGQGIDFKLDSGAQVNIIPEQYLKYGSYNLSKSNAVLKSYTGHVIDNIGCANVDVKFGSTTVSVLFNVVRGDVKPVLGRDTCERLGLLQRGSLTVTNAIKASGECVSKCYSVAAEQSQDVSTDTERIGNEEKMSPKAKMLVEGNSDLMDGLGQLAHHQYDIRLSHDYESAQNPPRTVPYAKRDAVHAELQRMCKLNVITPVKEPTEWINSMAVAYKSDGSLRICIDPADLNRAIRREHYPMQTLEDVVSRMPDAKVFSKVDAKSGYWQLRLSKESSLMTTFNTPFGRFRYLVLPFGISSASEIWQRAMIDEFGDLEGVEVMVDDFLIWGENDEQHDARLEKYMHRLRKSGMKLNRKKSKFSVRKVEFAGHTISEHGLEPTKEHIKSIFEMPEPRNKAELETFLGMINYLGKFVPNMSSETDLLRQLLQKNIAWHWDERHSNAVNRLKHLITSSPVLGLYDVNAEVCLSTDASNQGFGAVLSQHDRPIAYASRCLNTAEKNYAPIEKEMCAIVFACRKFHDYIFAKKTRVVTDHKPLIGLFNKPLSKLSPRLQRMRMHLLRYDLSLEWKPGKEMFIPDTLSRLPSNNTSKKPDFDDTLEVNMVTRHLPVSDTRLVEFRTETANDPELVLLRDMVISGWPTNKQLVPPQLLPYFPMRDDLVYCDGLLFRDNRIVVPNKMRKQMVNKIHESHQGIVKSKQRARTILFWPGMNGDIEDAVSSCVACQENRNSQPAEPMLPHEIPDRPWSKIAADMFHVQGKNFIVVVDYYSKFPEVESIPDMTPESSIQALKAIFSRNGIPDLFISDNARQFDCQQFRQFSNDWEFEHDTSSPGFAQSNGQAERTVQTVKKLIKKCVRAGDDPFIALLEYRNTPIDGCDNFSPSQMLNSRLLKRKLPTAKNLLKPHVVPSMSDQLALRQMKQKYYHDKSAKPELPQLDTGQEIKFRGPEGKWRNGTVAGKHEMPRSYIVQGESGRMFRRNRRHMFPIPNTKEPIHEHLQPPLRTDFENNVTMQDSDKGASHETNVQVDPPPVQSMSVADPHKDGYLTRSGRLSKRPDKMDL